MLKGDWKIVYGEKFRKENYTCPAMHFTLNKNFNQDKNDIALNVRITQINKLDKKVKRNIYGKKTNVEISDESYVIWFRHPKNLNEASILPLHFHKSDIV